MSLRPPTTKKYSRTNAIKDEDLEDAYKKWQKREISENSWMVKVEDIIKHNYDLSAKNPNRAIVKDFKPPKEIVKNIIEQEQKIAEILESVKKIIEG